MYFISATYETNDALMSQAKTIPKTCSELSSTALPQVPEGDFKRSLTSSHFVAVPMAKMRSPD